MSNKEKEWTFGFGLINTWSQGGRVVGFIPCIEYVENPFNKGFGLTFWGFGVFVGMVNQKAIEEATTNEESCVEDDGEDQ